MYTTCPECQISFRVTAKILQMAGGNVRCGNCDHAFSALAYLTEEVPEAPARGSSDVPDDSSGDKLAETSRRLLETLDELAGPENVRIEDTGIEWRVLGSEEPPGTDSAEEQRYDDNTPLPDDFGDENDDAYSPHPLQRRSEAHPRGSEQLNDRQQDLALSEPEDWTDLLDEVRDPGVDALQVEEELAAIHTELSDVAASMEIDGDEAAELDLEFGDADGDAELDIEVAVSGEERALDLELEASGQSRKLDLEFEASDKPPELDLDIDEAEEEPDLDFEFEEPEDAADADSDSAVPEEDVVAELDAAKDDADAVFDALAEEEDAEEGLVTAATEVNVAADLDSGTTEEDADAVFDALAAENDAGAAEEDVAADLDSGATEEDAEEDFVAGSAEEVSDEDLDSGATEADAAAVLDALATEKDAGEDLVTGSAEVESDADLDTGATEEETDADLDSLGTDEETDADLDGGPTEEEPGEVDESADVPGSDLEITADADEEPFEQDDPAATGDAGANTEEIEEEEPPAEPVLTVLADGSTTEERILERENADLHVPEPTEEEMTVNMEIDQELLAAAAADDGFTATLVNLENPEEIFEQNPEEVETIIMEGEFIRSAMDKKRLAAEIAAQDRLNDDFNPVDTYALRHEDVAGRWRIRAPGAGMMAGAIILLIGLGVQFVHNSRESLATMGFFNQTIAPVYRMLGMPVTPEWDIRGWQFEATNGSVNEEETMLTIVSRLGNRSANPLPYPLLHVSLTDRWEDIMGSRVLEPAEYLPDQLDPSRPVQPGDNFTAVIAIQDPSIEATGFKLNVCYRVTSGTVRCAIEDFKN